MSDAEHQILGIAFAACAAMIFLWAFPRYAWRHGPGKIPPLPTGKVPIAGYGLLDYIGISLLFGFYFLNWLPAREQSGQLGQAENLPVFLLLYFGFQAFLVIAAVAALFWRMNVVEAFGLKWKRWPWVLLIAPAALFVVYSLVGTLQLTGYAEWVAEITGGNSKQDAVQLLEEKGDPLTLVVMCLVFCIGAPLSEEVLFRGYLYGALKRFTNIPFAMFCSSLLFGVVHMHLVSLLPLFILAIVLVLLYEAFGSIWVPIAVHFLFNAVTVTLQIRMKYDPELREAIEKANEAVVRCW